MVKSFFKVGKNFRKRRCANKIPKLCQVSRDGAKYLARTYIIVKRILVKDYFNSEMKLVKMVLIDICGERKTLSLIMSDLSSKLPSSP